MGLTPKVDKYSVYRDEWYRLTAECEVAESRAGILEAMKARKLYSGTDDTRRIYFGVPDIDLRRATIAAHRKLMLYVQIHYYESQIQDESAILSKTRLNLSYWPWKIPALIGCAAVYFGYVFAGTVGAISGGLVGFFAGQAYINNTRQVDKHAADAAEKVIASYRKQQAENAAKSEIDRIHFTLEEEKSGQPRSW